MTRIDNIRYDGIPEVELDSPDAGVQFLDEFALKCAKAGIPMYDDPRMPDVGSFDQSVKRMIEIAKKRTTIL